MPTGRITCASPGGGLAFRTMKYITLIIAFLITCCCVQAQNENKPSAEELESYGKADFRVPAKPQYPRGTAKHFYDQSEYYYERWVKLRVTHVAWQDGAPESDSDSAYMIAHTYKRGDGGNAVLRATGKEGAKLIEKYGSEPVASGKGFKTKVLGGHFFGVWADGAIRVGATESDKPTINKGFHPLVQ